MNKSSIQHLFTEKYGDFVQYIAALSEANYAFHLPQKWNAAQQLEHIVLCVQPLVQVFSMDHGMIAQTFGTTSGTGRDYDTLLDEYQTKLKAGGKAPERFVPAEVTATRSDLTGKLTHLVQKLSNAIDLFTEEELDTLCIPHPLLGNLSLREMLYNAIYHVQHHEKANP